jgi:hypothetical protein
MKDQESNVAVTIIALAIIGYFLMSCSTTTTITDQAGQSYKVESKHDAIVTHEKDGQKVTVDNRGKRSLFEDIMGAYMLRWISKDEVRDE